MAELIDIGQARGEIAVAGKPINVMEQDIYQPATLPDLGITRQRLHEARKLETLTDEAIPHPLRATVTRSNCPHPHRSL